MGGNAGREFHAFTLRHSTLVDRIVSDVWISAAFRLTDPPPHPQRSKLRALWDTGANCSLITDQTAERLKLIPTGAINVRTASGTGSRPKHIINVFLPNQVILPGVEVTTCVNTVGDFDVIIGMDLISKGDFAITNHSGKTTMTFRVPSLAELDFDTK